jgi:predicted Zn-dependent protease
MIRRRLSRFAATALSSLASVASLASLGFLTLLAGCDGVTVAPRSSTEVYDFRLQSDTFHVFHWPAGKNIKVYINAPADAALAATLTGAFEHGAEQWNAYAMYGEYRLTRTTSIEDADVLLTMSNDVSPVNTDGCPPILTSGSTTFCLQDPTAATLHLAGYPLAPPADTSARNVKMLVTILTSQAGVAGRINILVAHELGHVLGIGRHSPDPGDLMAAGVPVRSTLSRRDIATVQVLYHTVPDILP